MQCSKYTKGDHIVISEKMRKMFGKKHHKQNCIKLYLLNLYDYTVGDFITFFDNLDRIYCRHKIYQNIKVLQLKRYNLKKILHKITSYKNIPNEIEKNIYLFC
tara:strand:- start:137 stop:445 length:309 start_codon:yes stop_codon:yes gene_type:complete